MVRSSSRSAINWEKLESKNDQPVKNSQLNVRYAHSPINKPMKMTHNTVFKFCLKRLPSRLRLSLPLRFFPSSFDIA